MSPRERDLRTKLDAIRARNAERELDDEVQSEQLVWLRDSMASVYELAQHAKHMRVADIRRALQNIVAECQADY